LCCLELAGPDETLRDVVGYLDRRPDTDGETTFEEAQVGATNEVWAPRSTGP
jgi:hypothetical protein